MDSPKLLLVLMAVAASMAAPQINERQVVGNVIDQLQPAIAAAVAQALAGGRGTGSSFGRATGGTRLATGAAAEPDYGPAQYDFSYKVSDDEKQAYIAQHESRNGNDVTGSYNFIDPTGSLVTVNYEAGPEGYSENRDVAKGAVVMREIPGAWTGPLAGVDDVQATSGAVPARNSGGGQSQSDLIARILAAIQPKIDSAVQSAIGSSSSFTGSATRASGFGQNSFGSTRSSSSGQDNIISSVISSLRPRINSAVNSVISSSRTAAVPRARAPIAVRPRPRSQGAASGNLAGVFGAEGSSVRVETPDFQFQF